MMPRFGGAFSCSMPVSRTVGRDCSHELSLQARRAKAIFACVNSKHRKTLRAVFTDPVSPNVAWSEIEALLVAVGARKIEGAGSRVRFEGRGIIASFHRPHPQKEAKRYQV